MEDQWRKQLLALTLGGATEEGRVDLAHHEQTPMRSDLFDLFELDELKKYYTGDELGGHRAGQGA